MNIPAQDAYRVAVSIFRFWARLSIARDMINDALDELPHATDREQDVRIEAIRDQLSKEIGLIFDLSKREAHRICNTPDSPAPPVPEFPLFFRGEGWDENDAFVRFDSKELPGIHFNRNGETVRVKDFRFSDIDDNIKNYGWIRLTKAEALARINLPPATPDPDEWVTQDLVPDRPGIDQWRWVSKDNNAISNWYASTSGPYRMHGHTLECGDKFEVRCRRKDLPTPTPPKTPCKCAWCSKPAFKGWDSGKCPYCGCQETEPSPTPPDSDATLIMDPPQTPYQFKSPSPAEDQKRTLSGSHGDYSLPVMDIDVQIFPPDPNFIQVDNPGIPGL